MDSKTRTINNRNQAHVTRIEFARIQEGHVIVRLTCKTARPEKTSVSTHLVPGAAAGESPDSRAIQNAIGELREAYPGTKVVLDPEAELEPITPLFKWTYSWQKPLARASLGLNWEKNFPFTTAELEKAWTLGDDDKQWVNAHGCEQNDSSIRATRAASTNGAQDMA